jgi:hypothetical protein
MTTDWIFQANPRRFKIDVLLSRKPKSTHWLASQHANQIAVGDRVFLWRSIAGGLKDESGVFAEAKITAQARLMLSPQDEDILWTQESDRNVKRLRVVIEFRRIAEKEQLLRRRWLQDDPILGDLSIFDMPRQTNYPIEVEQGDRIAVVWDRLSAAWSRDELVGLLWLATMQRMGPVSRGSDPVSEFSLRSGRSVVKVRSGVQTFFEMSAPKTSRTPEWGNKLERETWKEFYDQRQGVIDYRRLEAAYEGCWTSGRIPEVNEQNRVVYPMAFSVPDSGRDANEDFYGKSVAELFLALEREKLRPSRVPHEKSPSIINEGTDPQRRSRIVKAIAKVRASFKCEVPWCRHALFNGLDGHPYVEVHHIQPLSADGPDEPENVASLCPAHHREAHHGQAAAKIRAALEYLRSDVARNITNASAV